ncbi:MAG: hypothetical protein HYR74_04715 [Candidatus Eisenbacteria bacterium]|nr:hypothetical protein [Candidatus Eisenbacteria bacterium]
MIAVGFVVLGGMFLLGATPSGGRRANATPPPKMTYIEITTRGVCTTLDQIHAHAKGADLVAWHDSTTASVTITFTHGSPFGSPTTFTIAPGEVAGGIVSGAGTFPYTVSQELCKQPTDGGPDVIVDRGKDRGKKH